MAYRIASDLPRLDDPALRRARVELWLVEALVTREHRRRPLVIGLWALVLFGMVSLGVAGDLIDGRLHALGTILALVAVAVASIGDHDARRLARVAVARGLSKGLVQRRMTLATHEGYEGWHEEAVTKVQWYGWRAGLPTTMRDCAALADRLRRLPRRDAEQLRFLERMELWWTRGIVTEA